MCVACEGVIVQIIGSKSGANNIATANLSISNFGSKFSQKLNFQRKYVDINGANETLYLVLKVFIILEMDLIAMAP